MEQVGSHLQPVQVSLIAYANEIRVATGSQIELRPRCSREEEAVAKSTDTQILGQGVSRRTNLDLKYGSINHA